MLDDPGETLPLRQGTPEPATRPKFVSFLVGDAPGSNRVNAEVSTFGPSFSFHSMILRCCDGEKLISLRSKVARSQHRRQPFNTSQFAVAGSGRVLWHCPICAQISVTSFPRKAFSRRTVSCTLSCKVFEMVGEVLVAGGGIELPTLGL